MPPSLTLARRPGPRWFSHLGAAALFLLAWAPADSSFQAPTPDPQEVSSRDVEPTFKLQSERNVVMVRVVVRDGKGAAIDSLRKEDFQILDHGKVQTISHFSLEKPVLKSTGAPPQKPAEKTVPN